MKVFALLYCSFVLPDIAMLFGIRLKSLNYNWNVYIPGGLLGISLVYEVEVPPFRVDWLKDVLFT